MKKRLGALVLVLISLLLSAACASSRASAKPKPPQPQSEENWARVGPSVVSPAQPADFRVER